MTAAPARRLTRTVRIPPGVLFRANPERVCTPRGLRMVCMLGVSFAGHVVAALLLMMKSGPLPNEERAPAVEVTWLGHLPEQVSEPDLVPAFDPEAPIEPEISVPECVDARPLPAVPETPPADDGIVHPDPVLASVHVVMAASTSLESNYWFQVRSEMIRHLRWPAGLPRPALVIAELTVDDEGGLAGLSTHPAPGDEAYARVVERVVRRAAPFLPPGPVCRTARLPVRFSNHNPTEK